MLKSYSTNYSTAGTNAWTLSVDSDNVIPFNSITMSSSGQYLAACSNSNIFTSNNYGVNWTSGLQTLSASSITSSSSGQYLAALVNSQGVIGIDSSVYTSSNYGMTWENQITLNNCNGSKIISSSSGQYLAICGNFLIWLSDNYGSSWTLPTLPTISQGTYAFTSITISSSGQYLAASSSNIYSGGAVLVSSDFGVNWVSNSGMTGTNGVGNLFSITSSSSGKYLAVVFYNTSDSTESGVYTSEDYGENWTYQSNSPNNKNLLSITSSGSGQTIALCSSIATPDPSGCVFISNDYGVTWNTNPQLVITSEWNDIAISTSGQYLAVCSNSGTGIYTYSNNVDIGNIFGSMIEELQITQNNNNLTKPSAYFYWSYFTNPTAQTSTTPAPLGYFSSSGALAGALQGSAIYNTSNPEYGVNLITNTNTSGAIYWDLPEFGYNNNFEIIISVYVSLVLPGTGGGQISIGLGCPSIPTPVYPSDETNPNQSQYSQSGQLGLWCVFDFYSSNIFLYNSGILGSKQSNDLCEPGFQTITMRVITIGSNRIASTYYSGVLRNSVILQSGFNAGSYLIIAGSTGGFGNTFTCNNIEINYI